MDLHATQEFDTNGRLRSAEEIRLLDARQKQFESQVRQSPDDSMAKIQLAGVLLARGRMHAGARQLVDAVPTLPGDIDTILQLARFLHLCGETAAARECLNHPALQNSEDPSAIAQHATQRYILGEVPLALELIKKAIAAGADGPAENQLLATLLEFCGHTDEAVATLDACLERWPRFGSAAMARSRRRKQDEEHNHVEFLRKQLKEVPGDPANKDAMQVRAEFEFALFKELDDLGRYDEAWAALERGNALLRTIKPYDAQGEEKLTNALIDAAKRLPSSTPEYSPIGSTPIFIVGMPRSGTTLLDRMISSHSQVVSAGELEGFKRTLLWGADATPSSQEEMLRCLRSVDQVDFDAVRKRYLEQTAWYAQGKPFFIDKQPLNYQLVPFIRRAFPDAPILHIARDPMSVCFSNYKILFGQITPYNNGFDSLVHYYKQYARLTDYWQESLPGAMHRIEYSALVKDPENVMRAALEHCGLELEEHCIRPELNTTPVATPSSTQVREAIHTRSMNEWQNYAEHLEPLRLALNA